MADKSIGFIALWRSFEKWEWYDDIPVKTLFIHCLLKANYETKNWHGIEILKGQFVTSINRLAIETGLSVQQTRTALEKLIATHEITKSSSDNFTIITVKNWCEYQNNNTVSNKRITNEQHTSNILATTTNKDNKDNKDIPKGISNKKFTPPTLEELQEYITQNNYNVDAQRFIDFYESKGWLIGKNKMKDWKAAVRTWNSKEPQKPKPKKDIKDITLEDIKNGRY